MLGLTAKCLTMVPSGPSDLNVRCALGTARRAEIENYPVGWYGTVLAWCEYRDLLSDPSRDDPSPARENANRPRNNDLNKSRDVKAVPTSLTVVAACRLPVQDLVIPKKRGVVPNGVWYSTR